MAEVPTRLQQLDLAKSSLQTELREAHELDAERLRHDRDAAREEAEETARQVADAAAGSSKNVNDALGVCEETFSRKDAEWHRSSLTLKACLGAVSGQMLELWRSAEDPEQSADCVDREPGDDEGGRTVALHTDDAPQRSSLGDGRDSRSSSVWRLVANQLTSRKMALQQGFLKCSFGASEYPHEGIDRLETRIRQYQTTTKRIIDDDTQTSFFVVGTWERRRVVHEIW